MKETSGYTRIKLMVISKCHWCLALFERPSGMLSATASLGLILLWDVESGLTEIDKYLYSPEDYIKVINSVLLCVCWCKLVCCDDRQGHC